ncbi:MAG: hypothetical protein IJR97_09410 [Clostridia bacterium]|nr:hypothetical protein [Clostridia bacterium]
MKRFGSMRRIFSRARAAGEQAVPKALARLRGAAEADWVGGDLVLVKDPGADGELISMADGRTVLKNVDRVEPYGDKVFAVTADRRWYLAGPGGETVEIPCADCDRILSAEHGIIVYQTTSGPVGVWDLYRGKILDLRDTRNVDAEYDPVSGRVWIFDDQRGFYRDDGTRMLPDAANICLNADLMYILDGRVAVQRGGAAEVFDLKAEKITASYPGYIWRTCDSHCQIFDDHTALLDQRAYGGSPSIVGDLYGNILLRVENGMIAERYVSDPGYHWRESPDGPDDGNWYFFEVSSGDVWKNWRTDRAGYRYTDNYRNLRTGEHVSIPRAAGVIDPRASQPLSADALPGDDARAALYPPHRESEIVWPEKGHPLCAVYTPEGELLGHREWSDIDNYLIRYDASIFGRWHTIDLQGWCAVMDFNGKWGIVATDHHMILPLEFDGVEADGRAWHSTRHPAVIHWREGLGFIARRDGQWYIFDTEGRLIY